MTTRRKAGKECAMCRKRHEVERDLRGTLSRYRAIFDQAAHSIVIVDPRTRRFVDFNRMAPRNLGYTRAEFAGLRLDDIDVLGSPQNLAGRLRRIVEKGRADFLTKHRTKSGEIRDVQVSATSIVVGGRVLAQGICRDRTETLKVERALHDSEARYRSFVENFHGIAYRGRLADWSTVFFHGNVKGITGYAEREFASGRLKWRDLIHPDDLPGIMNAREKRLHSAPGYTYEREYRIVRKDGRIRWVNDCIQNLCDDSGKPVLVQGVIYDISPRKRAEADLQQIRDELEERVKERTADLSRLNEEYAREIAERKQAEESLAQSEKTLRYLLNASLDAAYLLDRSGVILALNDSGAERLGGKRADLVGRNLWDVTPPGWAEERGPFWKRALRARHSLRWELEWKGTWFDSKSFPIFGQDGRVSSVAVFSQDITKHRRAQAEIEQSHRQLRTLGARLTDVQEAERRRLARELHDQLGQSLTALGIQLHVLKENAARENRPEPVGRLDRAIAQVEDMTQAVRNVMAELRPPVLDDYGLLAALKWLAIEFRKESGLRVTVRGRPNGFRASARTELAFFRIAQEALNNVAKHSSGATRISISLESTGDGVEMNVQDNGVGFDLGAARKASAAEHWGLAIMEERALSVGGRLRIRTAPGRGTRIVVRAPPSAKQETGSA